CRRRPLVHGPDTCIRCGRQSQFFGFGSPDGVGRRGMRGITRPDRTDLPDGGRFLAVVSGMGRPADPLAAGAADCRPGSAVCAGIEYGTGVISGYPWGGAMAGLRRMGGVSLACGRTERRPVVDLRAIF